jgi:hypothetical protein
METTYGKTIGSKKKICREICGKGESRGELEITKIEN